MLKDITIGQFFPGKSVVHRLDPRMKIILTGVFIALLFMAKSMLALSVGILFMLFAFFMSRIPFRLMIKSIKPIIPIIIFTAVLNLFFISTGDVLFHFWIIKITTGVVQSSIFMDV